MTGKMQALQIVLDNSSGCTEKLAITRAWGERYRAEYYEYLYEIKVCELVKNHFSEWEDLYDRSLPPGHNWDSPPHDYDEWLQRYKEEYSNEKRPDGSLKDWVIPALYGSWEPLYASLKDDYDIASGAYASDGSEPDYERDLEDLRQEVHFMMYGPEF